MCRGRKTFRVLAGIQIILHAGFLQTDCNCSGHGFMGSLEDLWNFICCQQRQADKHRPIYFEGKSNAKICIDSGSIRPVRSGGICRELLRKAPGCLVL